MTNANSADNVSASQRINEYIEGLGDWRGRMVGQLRQVILEAEPNLTEEWKWDTPVWSHKGNVVAAGVFKDHVKLNFFKGATLNDVHGLFNAGLEAKASRGIDFHEGDDVGAAAGALKELVRAAVAQNTAGKKK